MELNFAAGFVREEVVLTFAHPSEEKGLNREGSDLFKEGKNFRKLSEINFTKVVAGLKTMLTFALPSARKGKNGAEIGRLRQPTRTTNAWY